jgi:hypothetical protein
MISGNYVSLTPRLMKSFDSAVARVKPILIARYGEEEANALMRESRQKYRDLIPQIPYIGDHNPLLDVFFFPASRHLGLYKAFREHGKTVEEAGRLVYEIGEAEIKAIPGLVRRAIGILWFSRWFTNRLQKRAELSRKHKYPGGYVVAFAQGDGKEFDYEFDYIECAVLNFYREQGAAELVPYLCAIDKIASELLGWGLRRTITLAEGGAKCDFQFKKGGKTCVTIPQSLRCYTNEERIKISNPSTLNREYVLVAVLSVMIGGLVIALATKAIPKMLAQTRILFMQKMMTQMQADGCSPSEM